MGERTIRTCQMYVFPGSPFVDYFLNSFSIKTTWMSQEVSNWLVNGLFHLLINRGLIGVKKPTDPNL